MTNALTVDVEDYFQVQAFAGTVPRANWNRYPLRVEQNTSRLLEMFGQRGIRATFFVLGWVAERCPGLIRQIVWAGHQIGCHGYAHQMICSGSRKEFREDLLHAKQVLEDLTGVEVKSYRAPSYSITRNTLWALEILSDAGFENDSSIFPVIHDNYGMPRAPRFPHLRSLSSGRWIREFPPSTLRFFGVNVPIAGGGYFRLVPYGITAWAIRRINEQEQQPAMVYLHPWEIDPDQPKIYAHWRSRFRHYHNLESTATKVSQMLDEFCWAPMEHVLRNSLAAGQLPARG